MYVYMYTCMFFNIVIILCDTLERDMLCQLSHREKKKVELNSNNN